MVDRDMSSGEKQFRSSKVGKAITPAINDPRPSGAGATRRRHRRSVPSRCRCGCCAQTGRPAPPHVGGRHEIPSRKSGGHGMICPPNIDLNGIVLTGRGSRLKPKMTAAPTSASQSDALHNQFETCVQRCPTWHQPDCDEKRDPDE